jgi:hypothetical protein
VEDSRIHLARERVHDRVRGNVEGNATPVHEERVIEPASDPDNVASARDGFDDVSIVLEWTHDLADDLACRLEGTELALAFVEFLAKSRDLLVQLLNLFFNLRKF